MPRPERELQMLESAHTLFAERGFAAVTMDDVAEAVGVTKPLLYSYWGNKEQLFLACLDRSAEALFDRLLTAVREADEPAEAVADAVHVFFAFVHEERAAWHVIFDPSSPTGEIPERVAMHRARLAGLIADAFLEMVPRRHRERVRTEVEGRSHAVLGAAEALARWWLTGASRMSAAQAADLLVETVVPGLPPGARKEDN
jgi:AcrR family transcriptional regulator